LVFDLLKRDFSSAKPKTPKELKSPSLKIFNFKRVWVESKYFFKTYRSQEKELLNEPNILAFGSQFKPLKMVIYLPISITQG
jgi:hypothetical protein